MTAYAIAWALCATAGAFVVLAVVVGLEIHDRFTADPAQVPRVPEQRQPTPTSSAAALVVVHNAEGFDRFLAELIVTPHIEDVIR